MGQFGSKRQDETSSATSSPSKKAAVDTRSPQRLPNIFNAVNVSELLAARIPDVFLVHEKRSGEYIDEDGDVADEFYLEERPSGKLRRLTANLRRKGKEKLAFPRLHPDLPVVMVQVKQ